MWRRTPLPRISATPSTRSSRRCSVREPPPRTRTRTSSTSPKRFSRKSGECRTWFNISATETSADASPTPKEQIPFPVPATLSRSSNPTRSRFPEEFNRDGTISTARAIRALTTEKASSTPLSGSMRLSMASLSNRSTMSEYRARRAKASSAWAERRSPSNLKGRMTTLTT